MKAAFRRFIIMCNVKDPVNSLGSVQTPLLVKSPVRHQLSIFAKSKFYYQKGLTY